MHPPIGSEINPFSDRWLEARGFQTEPQAAGPGGGKRPKREKKNKQSLHWSKKKNTKWNKTKTEAIGWLQVSSPSKVSSSLDVCVCMWLRH